MKILRCLLGGAAAIALSGCAASVVSGHGTALGASSSLGGSSSLGASSSSSESTSQGSQPGGVAADDGTFSVRLPSGWSVGSGSDKVVAFYQGPTIGGFTTNVNVVDSDRPGAMSVRDYTDANLNLIKDRFHAAIVDEPSPTRVGGEPAFKYTYTWTYQGVRLKQRQTVVIHDQRGYVITYSATPNSFFADMSNVDGIVESWQWT